MFCLNISMCTVCIPGTSLGQKRGRRIPWDWNYGWLWTTMWILTPLLEHLVLIAEPPLLQNFSSGLVFSNPVIFLSSQSVPCPLPPSPLSSSDKGWPPVSVNQPWPIYAVRRHLLFWVPKAGNSCCTGNSCCSHREEPYKKTKLHNRNLCVETLSFPWRSTQTVRLWYLGFSPCGVSHCPMGDPSWALHYF